MDSSLKERFERLGPVRVADRVVSGSAGEFVLGRRRGATIRPVEATLALVKRGMTMLSAKRAVEAVLENGRAVVSLPSVEGTGTFSDDLRGAGMLRASLTRRMPDVRALREELGLTQERFARSYGIPEDTLRKWEQHEREPDEAAKSYLIAIRNRPKAVSEAYAPMPAEVEGDT